MVMQLVLPQMSASAERPDVARGEAARDPDSGETSGPRHGNERTGSALLQAALIRENLQQAFKRVRANKGVRLLSVKDDHAHRFHETETLRGG